MEQLECKRHGTLSCLANPCKSLLEAVVIHTACRVETKVSTKKSSSGSVLAKVSC